jgi:hypothetical protein
MLYYIKLAVHVPQADAAVKQVSSCRNADGIINCDVAAKQGGRVVSTDAF